MKIKDLAPELQKLVHKRQIEQYNDGLFDGNLGNGESQNNFSWSSTEEGQSFWNDINNRKDMRSHPKYPKLEVINNYLIY